MAKNKLDSNAYGSWGNLITHVVLLVLATVIYQNNYCSIMKYQYFQQQVIEFSDLKDWMKIMRSYMIDIQRYLTILFGSVICTLWYMSKNKWFVIEMLATFAFVAYWITIINLIVPEPKPTLLPFHYPDQTPDEDVYYNMPNQAVCM